MKYAFKSLAALAFGLAMGHAAHAFPDQELRLVLPFNPGGIVDTVGRSLGSELSDIWGQNVVPDNRPGAGGAVGADAVARADPDGHTFLLWDPAISTVAHLRSDLAFDPLNDFEPISIVSTSPLVLVIWSGLPVENFDEFVEYAKENPGTLNFASAGLGTVGHLTAEQFVQELNIDAGHVPYNGIGPSFADLVTGVVHFSFSSLSGALPFTEEGSVLAIATTGETRSTAYPEVPTLEEAGFPQLTAELWMPVLAPAGLPEEVADALNASVNAAAQTDAFKNRMEQLGLTAHTATREETRDMMEREYERWGQVIQSLDQ